MVKSKKRLPELKYPEPERALPSARKYVNAVPPIAQSLKPAVYLKMQQRSKADLEEQVKHKMWDRLDE